MKHKVIVLVNSDRPDFRLFNIFLWGEGHSYDSEGDSYNPASRTWTYLYNSSRELKDQAFEINKIEENPLKFEVTSENEYLVNRVAFFLCKETTGQIYMAINATSSCEDLIDKLGNDFDLRSAIERAEISIWRKSTLENPYPNLNK